MSQMENAPAGQGKKVLFLDIDGVLQPYNNQFRFDHDMAQTCRELAEKYGDPVYPTMDKYDVCAVVYDWDAEAVQRLKDVLDKTGARIVVSSDWRRWNGTDWMRALLRLHGLDPYFDECLPKEGEKEQVIPAYLREHMGELAGWVVVDDWNMERYFGDHFVLTRDRLQPEDCAAIERALALPPAWTNPVEEASGE